MFHISIQSLTVENFGPFFGPHTFDFIPEDDRDAFVLIGGKNGAGKTHLLRALYLAVVGETGVGDLKKVEAGSEATRFRFEKSLNRKAEREGGDTSRLSITLRHRDLNGGSEKTLTLERHIRHRRNSPPVWNTRAIRSGGMEETDADTIAKWRDAFLPRDLARFFFFDAERSQNVQLGEKEIVDGVSKILGLTAYEALEQDLRQLISAYIPRHFEISSDVDAVSKAAAASGEIVQCDGQIRSHRNSIEDAKLKKSEDSAELAETEEKLRSYGAVNPDKLQADQARRDDIAKAKISIESKLAEAWESALPVALLGEQRVALHWHLLAEERKRQWEDRKAAIAPKIPEIKAEVFEHASEDYTLDPDVRNYYSERLDRALHGLFHPPPVGVEHVEVFVTDRTEVSVAVRSKLAASAAGLVELVDLNEQLERHEANLRDLDYEIRKQAQDAAAMEAGKALYAKRGELLARVAGYEKQIEEHEAEIARLETRLIDLRRQEKLWRVAEAKASEGRNVLARAHAYREAAHEVRTRAAERLRRKIAETVGDLWIDITERNREFKALEFDAVWQCYLVRSGGQRVQWDEVNPSAGQRQVRLLAFNEALRRLAQLVPPLVVDTPMGRLSRDVREAVLERLYLQGHQSIILSTDTEMDAEGTLFAKVRDRFGIAYTLESAGAPDSPDYEVEVVRGKYFGKRI